MMTHHQLLLLHEAATAGWHGAKARDAMFNIRPERGLVITRVCNEDYENWAVYHARLAARAALRAIHALEEE